jgi:hypothetical protein
MRPLRFLLVFALVVLPVSLHAQHRTAVSQVDATKLNLIRQILQQTGAVDQALVAMETAIPAQRAASPQVPPAFWSKFIGEARAGRRELEDKMILIFDRHFTAAELKELSAFYETPIGRRLVRAQPSIWRESAAAGAEWGKLLGERVTAKLEAEGIDVP